MTVKEIVAEWLKKNGYGGLCRCNGYDGCGCGIDDLMPCMGEGVENCQPGHRCDLVGDARCDDCEAEPDATPLFCRRKRPAEVDMTPSEDVEVDKETNNGSVPV